MRGRRLNDTPIQRQGKVYAPDTLIKVEVEEAGHRLHAHFVDDRHMVLAQGEYKHQRIWLTNSGTRPIGELWLLAGEEDELWIDMEDGTGEPIAPIACILTYVDSRKNQRPRLRRRLKYSNRPIRSPQGSLIVFQ